MDVEAEFSKYKDEWVKFEEIKNPRSKRRDLCAFLMLDDLSPNDWDIISAAEHDQIWINVDWDAFCAAATPELIHDLVACGVFCDDESLSMYA